MTLEQIIREARALSPQERKQLITVLIDSLVEPADEPAHSILELAGLGASLEPGEDAQEYVRKLRDEWNERP